MEELERPVLLHCETTCAAAEVLESARIDIAFIDLGFAADLRRRIRRAQLNRSVRRSLNWRTEKTLFAGCVYLAHRESGRL